MNILRRLLREYNVDPLLRQTSSKLLFTLVMAIYSFCLGLVISLVIWTLGLWSGADSIFANIPEKVVSPLLVVFRSLVLSPVLESLGLVGLILLGEWFGLSRSIQIFGPSVAWSALHSLAWPPWGFIVAPLFFLCSYSFIRWREESFSAGLITAILIHAWHNVFPITALLVRQFSQWAK